MKRQTQFIPKIGCFFALAGFILSPTVGAADLRQEPVHAVPIQIPITGPTPKPTPEIIVALPNYDEETATRLQIFFDNSDFGPGKIDGKMGEFFRKALISYKHAHGMRETGAVDQWLLDQVPVTFTTYTIKGDDLLTSAICRREHAAQAKLKFLPYTSLLEFVAERYHSAEAYIQKLNPGMNCEHLEPGDELKVPNVLPFEIEKIHRSKVKENPAFKLAEDFCRYKGAASRSLRKRSARLRFSDYARINSVTRPDWDMENSRYRHLAVVPLR